MIELPRRSFLTGLASLMVAPAIVKASSLMPVKDWQFIGNIDAANQIGHSITTWPMSDKLHLGDIVTIDGVDAINRITKKPNGMLRQFVVTLKTNSKDRVICLYPPLLHFETFDGCKATTNDAPKPMAAIRLVNLK